MQICRRFLGSPPFPQKARKRVGNPAGCAEILVWVAGCPTLRQLLRDGFVKNFAHCERHNNDVLTGEEPINLSERIA